MIPEPVDTVQCEQVFDACHEFADEALLAQECMAVWLTFRKRMREEARRLGYTLAVHGSMRRDIDLVAVPWIQEAAAPEELVKALCDVVVGTVQAHADGQWSWSDKPHGRRAISILIPKRWSSHTYLDVSVLPLREA